MIRVLVFTEGEFEIVLEKPWTLEEASAFAQGAGFGAGYYAGSLAAYVMPRDETEMREREKPDEIKRALAAKAENKRWP